MAVTLEGGFPTQGLQSTTTITKSITVGAGANRLLLVFITHDQGSTSGTPQYGGVNLTLLATKISGVGPFTSDECWYMVNPPTGTANLTATRTGGTSFVSTSYVFDGVNQTTPLRAQAGGGGNTGTSTSHTVTGYTAGDWGLDIISFDTTGFAEAPNAGQTADYADQNFGAGTTSWRGSNDQIDGVMGWTWTGTTDFAHLATAVIPVGAAASASNQSVWPIALRQFNLPGRPPFGFFPLPAAPTVAAQSFNQALTATATTTAAITKQTNKLVTATATTTASITKQVTKIVTATATTTGSIAKQVGKFLSATTTSTATLAAIKVILKTLTATVTTTATIAKQVNKPLNATVTTTASIVKQVNKIVQATVTSTATLAAIRVILKTLTATVTTTATIVRQVGTHLNATVTTTATIAKRMNKFLTSTVTTTAAMSAIRVILKTLTATVTTSASMLTSFLGGVGKIITGRFRTNPGGTATGSPSDGSFDPPNPGGQT